MSRENAAVKARRYLVEARVRIREADEDGGILVAEVRGDTGRIHACGYEVDRGWWWWCSCPAAAFGGRCSHIRSLQLVTIMEPRK